MRQWSTFPAAIGSKTCAACGGLPASGATSVATHFSTCDTGRILHVPESCPFFTDIFAAPVRPQIKMARHVVGSGPHVDPMAQAASTFVRRYAHWSQNELNPKKLWQTKRSFNASTAESDFFHRSIVCYLSFAPGR